MIINNLIENWLIVLLCWIVFSIIIIFGDKIGKIYIDADWFYILLTFPVTLPAIIIIIPFAFIIKIFRKIKNKNKKTLDKKKKM